MMPIAILVVGAFLALFAVAFGIIGIIAYVAFSLMTGAL